MQITAIQILADKVDSTTEAGQYSLARLARTQHFGYLPFHQRCWDSPTWAVNLARYMEHPRVDFVPPNLSYLQLDVDVVFGSVMACNIDVWRKFIHTNPHVEFFLGGYLPSGEFTEKNVKWCNSLEQGLEWLSLIQGDSKPTVHNPDFYPSSPGSHDNPFLHGVRITLSRGCKHKCSFCDVSPRGDVIPLTNAEIHIQTLPLVSRNIGIVYIDDKTFGQSPNWRMLNELYHLINPAGFVVQSTALQICTSGLPVLREWKDAGIIAVEIGIESYNDNILKRYQKPAREPMIDEAIKLLAKANLLVCPNIIVGMEGESKESYNRTTGWMRRVDNLGWFNMYCLADYSSIGQDASESSPLKSWQTIAEQTIAQYGFHLLYQAATLLMERGENGMDILARYRCPHCHMGLLRQNQDEPDALSCINCGHRVYLTKATRILTPERVGIHPAIGESLRPGRHNKHLAN